MQPLDFPRRDSGIPLPSPPSNSEFVNSPVPLTLLSTTASLMATPSSSATSSASPPMSYLQATTIIPATTSISANNELAEREERKKAVQKFLARAEISMVSRIIFVWFSLETRLDCPTGPSDGLESMSSGTQMLYNALKGFRDASDQLRKSNNVLMPPVLSSTGYPRPACPSLLCIVQSHTQYSTRTHQRPRSPIPFPNIQSISGVSPHRNQTQG